MTGLKNHGGVTFSHLYLIFFSTERIPLQYEKLFTGTVIFLRFSLVSFIVYPDLTGGFTDKTAGYKYNEVVIEVIKLLKHFL